MICSFPCCCRLSGTGRTDLMRRVSRCSRRNTPATTPKITPKHSATPINNTAGNSGFPATGGMSGKDRKTSLEGAVKHLTDLAVTITPSAAAAAASTADNAENQSDSSSGSGKEKPDKPAGILEKPTGRYTSGFSGISGVINAKKKLKRTNLMKRRESQALLEGVRKNRLQGTQEVDSDQT